jgi:hypothetical protein
MKLNHNSLSARLYRWFYITDTMPQTLCPYFWKLVIMWVLIVPVGILSLPIAIIKEDATEWSMRIIGGALLWGIAFMAFLMLFPLTYFVWGWFTPKSVFGAWQITGIMLWAISIICGIVWGVITITNKRREKKRLIHREYIWNEDGDYIPNPDYVPYVEKPNIIIEFIKAKYNKYCPTIEWNSEN